MYVLSPTDQVTKAETIQASDCVDSNFSFTSTNSDGKKFRLMFPDSKIAAHCKQAGTKTKYVLQFSVALSFKKKILKDFKDQLFTFKFDETTSSQVKNSMMDMSSLGQPFFVK